MESETKRRTDRRLEVAIGDNPELSARLLEMKERLQPQRRRPVKKTEGNPEKQSEENISDFKEG